MVWLILLAVAAGILAGFWLGALYGVLLVPVFVGLVVALEEWRTRRRRGVGNRAAHFDANKAQFANYTDRNGPDSVTAYQDIPSRGPAAPGVNVDEGDRAP
ncbi:MAG TPA: hypothetical protein VL687_06820 [Methylomirabilota bacterium]|nr:hypothetical protein [Methylomirabilota bacterium]